jgi:lysylphosphatidylglycerol synthetase-like protein (DUF2156 family)
MGARALVVADLRLGDVATEVSSLAADQVARAVRAWSGPGAVVVAGDLFDLERPGPASLAASLAAHRGLRDALAEFASAAGRRVVVLPGRRDAWLAWSAPEAGALSALAGAEVAPAVLAELTTASGCRTVRIEPGDYLCPALVGRTGTSEPGHQRLADVLPGVWRGRTSCWLMGMSQLDDPAATSRFVASRLVYRQLGRRAWLLAVPVLVAMLARLPVALFRPARHFAGPLLTTAAAVAVLEAAVVLALAAASLRQIWLAFSGKGGEPRDLNETARASARELAGNGLAGLVTGGTCRPELTRVGTGFYANAGCCADVVSEYAPRFRGIGFPSPFLGSRQIAWVELEAGNELHARLLYGQVLLPGASMVERLIARVPAPRRDLAQGPVPGWQGPGGPGAAGADSRPGRALSPVVVASFPNGRAWPPVATYGVPHRGTRRSASFVVAAAGFVSLVSAFSAPVGHRLSFVRQFLPLAVPRAAGALAALGGLGLIMLARGIHRGQRRAYVVCQVTLVAVALLHLVRAGSILGTVAAVVVAGFLFLRRASFRASSDSPTFRRGLARLLALGAAAALAGTFALEGSSWFSIKMHHRRLARIGWGQAFLASVERMVGVRHVALPDRLDGFFAPAMFSVTAGLVVVAAWMVFRPVVARRPRGVMSGGLARARDVVRRYGAGTLDYFALRSDKQFFFWGETVVAYAVYSGVCLVSPDPVGPLAQREEAWRRFRDHADSNGWALAVLGAGEDWLPIYRSTGMNDLYVGDEAVVHAGHFALDGGKFKGLRQAVKRVARHGYTITFHDPACIEAELAGELQDVMTKSRRGGVERGFSMTLGRIFDPGDQGLLLAVVHGPPESGADNADNGAADNGAADNGAADNGAASNGAADNGAADNGAARNRGPAVAFCQYVPAPAINGFSLDLMRRDNSDHPNGLIDFAIVETVRYLGERGYDGLGLNFATMRAVLAGEAGDSMTQRVQAWLLRRMSGSMQIESLWRFNAKFDPEWQPRYAVYDSPEHALGAALAVARAESFWELPLIGRFLVPSAQRQEEAAAAGPRGP